MTPYEAAARSDLEMLAYLSPHNAWRGDGGLLGLKVAHGLAALSPRKVQLELAIMIAAGSVPSSAARNRVRTMLLRRSLARLRRAGVWTCKGKAPRTMERQRYALRKIVTLMLTGAIVPRLRMTVRGIAQRVNLRTETVLAMCREVDAELWMQASNAVRGLREAMR